MLEVIKKETILGMELRVFGDVENPLFLAKEIAEHIEYSNSNISKMLELVDDEDEKMKYFGEISESTKLTSPTESRVVEGATTRWFLTEDGVYSILMKSNVQKAKEFRKGFKLFLKAWRKGEVKVVNVRTDSYMLSDSIERAKAWILEEEERVRLMIENKEIKKEVISVVNKLENVTADIRTNIVSAIRRLSSLYCKHHGISGIEKERIMREMFQTVYSGYCKEYNIDWVSVGNARTKHSKNGKELKGKRSIIETFEHLNLAGNLIEYIRELDITKLKV
ncbi:MAG: BRO-N domain-containing protein [Fusobacteriaceae bacterium]